MRGEKRPSKQWLQRWCFGSMVTAMLLGCVRRTEVEVTAGAVGSLGVKNFSGVLCRQLHARELTADVERALTRSVACIAMKRFDGSGPLALGERRLGIACSYWRRLKSLTKVSSFPCISVAEHRY